MRIQFTQLSSRIALSRSIAVTESSAEFES